MDKIPNSRQVLFLVVLACAFWWFTFGLKLLNFWVSMSLAALTLTFFSIYFTGFALKRSDVTPRNFLIGAASAVVLYGVFVAGNYLAQVIFHFAKPEVAAIYDIRSQAQALAISLVLLFVTSPGEELFWRAFLQRWAQSRFGGMKGWLLGAFIYAAVHIFSGNVMLTLAALTAGLFWGLLYWKSGSIFACIVSHALWTVGIFVLWPVG